MREMKNFLGAMSPLSAKVTITPSKDVYTPGENASVDIAVTDQLGAPVKAELALAVSRGVLTSSEVAPLERALARTRHRSEQPDDIVVAALAGGTGSGKSSILNAIAGEEVAPVGGLRPTTHFSVLPGMRAI